MNLVMKNSIHIISKKSWMSLKLLVHLLFIKYLPRVDMDCKRHCAFNDNNDIL